MGPLYYRSCWHRVRNPLFLWYRQNSSHRKDVYDPKAFIHHAASLGHAFAHCRRFSTAATRRCLDSVSVPVCRVMLSHPVGIVGLVSLYLTNYLILRRPFPKRINPLIRRPYAALATLSGSYSSLWGTFPRVTQPSAARQQVINYPCYRSTCMC